jgi:hypothetical protein
MHLQEEPSGNTQQQQQQQQQPAAAAAAVVAAAAALAAVEMRPSTVAQTGQGQELVSSAGPDPSMS